MVAAVSVRSVRAFLFGWRSRISQLALVALASAATGCGGSLPQGTSLPLGPQQSLPQRPLVSKEPIAKTYAIAPEGGVFQIPGANAPAGAIDYGSNNSSAATFTLTNFGSDAPAGAPAAYVHPALYVRAQIGGVAAVSFAGDVPKTMTIASSWLQPDATYEIDAYLGRRQISSYETTPIDGRLTMPSPLSGTSLRAGVTLLIEVTAYTDWHSFAFDLQHTGYNPVETTVGAANIRWLTKVWSAGVGSNVVHEPVYVHGITVDGRKRNLLYAGSAWGATMYALDADTGDVVWQDPVPFTTYTCGTKVSQFSIGETPAIDRRKHVLYFGDGHNQVHAVDLRTGVERAGWPITIADYAPDQNFLHGGFTYNPANRLLYAVTGSTCDISPWFGRVVAIDTRIAAVVGTFFPMSGTATQGQSGGGIWGPGGASIDPATNHVFVAIGNADTHVGSQQQNAAYAEQIVELSPKLNHVIANDYPTNIPVISGFDDFDFGATPLLFQPPGCPPLLAAVNKSGMFELYDRAAIRSGPIQYVAMSIPTDDGDFVGVPAYDPATGYVYVGLPTAQGIYQPGLAAFSMQSNCTLNPTPVWAAQFGPQGQATGPQTPRSPISIANGIVYVANYSGQTEYAFDAATGVQLWTISLPSLGNIGTVVANGKVYVSSGGGNITAWALPPQKPLK